MMSKFSGVFYIYIYTKCVIVYLKNLSENESKRSNRKFTGGSADDHTQECWVRWDYSIGYFKTFSNRIVSYKIRDFVQDALCFTLEIFTRRPSLFAVSWGSKRLALYSTHAIKISAIYSVSADLQVKWRINSRKILLIFFNLFIFCDWYKTYKYKI